MPFHPHIRAYLCSVVYAAALLFIPVQGPRLLGAALLQLVICASLLALLLLFLSYRGEIREVVLSILRRTGNAIAIIKSLGIDARPEGV
jgi:hypothetical protein